MIACCTQRIVLSHPVGRRRGRLALVLTLLIAAAGACGEDVELGGGDGGIGDGDGGGGGDGGGSGGDGGGVTGDGGLGGSCTADSTQCNNCIDDDGDGQIDGFDVECTGAADDDEASFATGINGDNIDQVKQDCFFDGNSGAGNDGCDLHVCCFLDVCPEGLPGPAFDPETDCPAPTAQCLEVCQPLTPPGCDCFGCCTVCNGDGCVDVAINPTTAPDCDADTLGDADACPRCTKVESCSNPCGPEDCILCPGESADDLPPDCEAAACPTGLTECETSDECGDAQFCSNGCCIAVIS